MLAIDAGGSATIAPSKETAKAGSESKTEKAFADAVQEKQQQTGQQGSGWSGDSGGNNSGGNDSGSGTSDGGSGDGGSSSNIVPDTALTLNISTYFPIFGYQENQEQSQTQPADDRTFGKTDHVVAEGDTLETIAAAQGQTVDDLLLANPGLTTATPLDEGMTVSFYDEVRLEIAQEIATTTDPDRLNQLVLEEITYATSQSATPEDLLPSVQQDILARRPGDTQLELAVGDQSAWSGQLWRSQGRTHEVMDQIQSLTAEGNQEALEQYVLGIFQTVATTSPTAQAIEGQRNILLAYGPENPVFIEAVSSAETYFTTEWPQEAAANIATTYTNEGPVAAGELLASYTDASTVDPLTAANILNAAQPTVSQLITHLGMGGWHEWPNNPTPRENFYILPEEKEALFGYLSAAADNASRSGNVASQAIRNMAGQINAQGFGYVARSIINGDGIILPLEMLSQSNDEGLARTILVGINQLEAKVRDSVDEFNQTALELTEPTVLWGNIVADPDSAMTAILDQERPGGPTLREMLTSDLERISEHGYQLMRVTQALAQYSDQLGAYPELIEAGALPAEGSDFALEFALGGPDALIEAMRAVNLAGLQNNTVMDPVQFFKDANWQLRMIRNTARAYGPTMSGQPASHFGTGTPLGIGLSLFGNLTHVAGVVDARENWNTGWYAHSLSVLNLWGATAESAFALSGLVARSNGLVGLTQMQIDDLPMFQRQIAMAAIRDPNSLLMTYSKFNSAGFGVFHLAVAVDQALRGNSNKSTLHALAGTGILMTPTSLLGGTTVTLLASFAIYALDERMKLVSYTEPFQQSYLEGAGIRPEIAEVLADNDWNGTSTAPFIAGLSEYLNLQPGELLDWFNAQSPEEVSEFLSSAFTYTNAFPDVPFGEFYPQNPQPYMTYEDLDAIIQDAQERGNPLPDRRGEDS